MFIGKSENEKSLFVGQLLGMCKKPIMPKQDRDRLDRVFLNDTRLISSLVYLCEKLEEDKKFFFDLVEAGKRIHENLRVSLNAKDKEIDNLRSKVDSQARELETLKIEMAKMKEDMGILEKASDYHEKVKQGKKVAYRSDVTPAMIKGLLDQGFTKSQIAERLNISRGTVYERVKEIERLKGKVGSVAVGHDGSVAVGQTSPVSQIPKIDTSDIDWASVKLEI